MLDFVTREAVAQNLKDAGCSTDTIRDFMAYYDDGNVQKQLILLDCHRKQLLSEIHREEKRISCLDYLFYQIEKNKKGY